MFGDVFEVHDTVFVMDATAPGSAAARTLKQYLADCKAKVTQVSQVMRTKSARVVYRLLRVL